MKLKTLWRQQIVEEKISNVEDRVVEINEAEKKKELKEMRTTSETSGAMSNSPTFES